MDYNFLNYDANVEICSLCIYDSNIGYEANFSVNGNVDNWSYFDGIHTYGCWSNFLFGTLYGDQALIGRYYNIMPVDGEVYYLLNISMLIKPTYRNSEQKVPTRGKFMWTTFESALWSEDKSIYFDIGVDSNWHTYSIDLSSKQKWVGNISNLRIYPIYEHGRDGDEFFIKTIEIRSKSSYVCDRIECSYYNKYSHPCGGSGKAPYCESIVIHNKFFTVEKDVNDFLIININNYGDEYISIDSYNEIKCAALAKKLTKAVGAINIGGYAEAIFTFTPELKFKLITGTVTSDSSIVLKYSQLAEELGFFNSEGDALYFSSAGETPASVYRPLSSFKITPSQLTDLTDNFSGTYVEFDPNLYNIEGGRNDWYSAGLGIGNIRVMGDSDNSLVIRSYNTIGGKGKTLIDFSHPFNASGRVNKAYICGTTDYGFERVTGPDGALYSNGEWGMGRLYTTDVKIKIFRPRNDGTLEVVKEIIIPDRGPTTTTLTSKIQEYSEADCDIFVNKGDLIGVYNISLYYGKTLGLDIIDASYYELEGDYPVGSRVFPGIIHGEGNAGLLLYVRSDQKQTRLNLSIDLNHRINVRDIKIKGSVLDENIEYNIMRCLDFSWVVDLFGKTHNTQFRHALDWGKIYRYTLRNTAYGENRLNDGIYTVPEGKAADSFTMAGPTVGVVPHNPYYFFVNGDHEWLKVHYWPEYWKTYSHVDGFVEDPIAFTIIFPYAKVKTLHKFKVHFKENWNFRSFALSTYDGPLHKTGNADDPRYTLIPEYKTVSLDGRVFSKDKSDYGTVDKYLFANPSIGHPIQKSTGGPGWTFPGDAILPGGGEYTSYGVVLNADQFDQSKTLDWKILQHEWEPFSCYGFRFYCFYHESTKICEMELFGYIEGGVASIAAGANLLTSFYGEDWEVCEISENYDRDAFSNINNSIRYIDVSLNPINVIFLTDIEVSVTDSALLFGDKGCDDILFVENNMLETCNNSQRIDIKNNYVDNTALFVDITKAASGEKRTLYYSSLSSNTAIVKPDVGPAATYCKDDGFFFRNQNNNVAINCECYGLCNKIIGAKAFYSYNAGYSWELVNDGQLLNSAYVNFSNLPNLTYSVMHLPILYKSKYWRLSLQGYDNVLSIREIKVYRQKQLLDVVVYHDRQANVNYTPAQRRAPHLINKSVTGSYYKIKSNEFITIELPEADYIDEIVFYNDYAANYTHFGSENKFCGVDRYVGLYLDNTATDVYDFSYHEIGGIEKFNVAIVNHNYTTSYSKEYDFANSLLDYAEWRSSDNSFSYVTPSGVLASGVYEYPGYIDFSIYLRYTSSMVLLQTPMSTLSDIFYFVDGFPSPSFNIKVAMSIHGVTTDTRAAIVFGFISGYYRIGGWDGDRFGIQATVSPGGFGIISQLWDSTNDTIYKSYNVIPDLIYYYIFSGDGFGNYELRVYTDGFEIGTPVSVVTLYSTKQWENLYVGFAELNYSFDTSIYGKIFYFSIDGTLLQKHIINEDWKGSLSFNGAENSYITVPYQDAFNFGAKRFCIDFFAKFDEFPYGIKDIANDIDMYPVNIIFTENGRYGWRGYFAGNSYIYMLSNGIFNLGKDRFTIDFLYTVVNIASSATFLYRANTYKFYYDVGDSKFKFEGYVGGVKTSSIYVEGTFELNIGATYHVALSRSEADLLIFIDGVLIGSSSVSGTIDYAYNLYPADNFNIYIGATVGGSVSNAVYGYIEEFRITKGFTRWSEDFALPAVSYNVDLYTVFLGRFGRDYVVLIENYNNTTGAPSQTKAWSVKLIQYSTYHALKFTYNSSSKIFDFLSSNSTGYAKFKRHLWNHIAISVGHYNQDNYNYLDININGKRRSSVNDINIAGTNIASGGNPLIIGRYLKGAMKNIRISRTDSASLTDKLGSRFIYNYDVAYSIPFRGYGRLYTFSIYNSDNNNIYGHHSDIDLYKYSIYSYFDNRNTFAAKYSSLFAIDLGDSYDLFIVRSFGASPVAPFSLNSNVIYSKVSTDNPYEVLSYYNDTTDEFEQQNFSTDLANWLIDSSSGGAVYVLDSLLKFEARGNSISYQYAKITSNYIIKESFELQVEYGLIIWPLYPWSFEIRLENFSNSSQGVLFERTYSNSANKYILSIKDLWNSSYTKVFESGTIDIFQYLKIVRFGSFFYFYKRANLYHEWVLLCTCSITTNYWEYTKVVFELKSKESAYPNTAVYIDNIQLVAGDAYYSNYKNARWLLINVLNGDGVSRIINRVGIYTNIQVNLAPDGHGKNNTWIPLGNAVTSYTSEVNLAYTAAVTVSSQVASLPYMNLIDSDKNSYWGSGYRDAQPYVILDLGEIYQIYRIRLYYGKFEGDYEYLVKNYTVTYSTNGTTYSTLANITNNTLYERSHDANPYIIARYIKLNITSYTVKTYSIYDLASRRYIDFDGAIVREIEVFKYKGTVISSEQYPIVAIDLRKQFYLGTNHEVLGVDYENKQVVDWGTAVSSFCYSNSFFDTPEKVTFNAWGTVPIYEKWAVIIKDSASYYNNGPHYMRTLVIRSIDKENPTDTSYWWSSYYSILSNSYDFLYMGRVLQIFYPAATTNDELKFIEGDSFGVDSICSWRDTFSFSIFINNINYLDTDYGYFYLGGYDSTSVGKPVIYIWNISGIKDKINSGLNYIKLGFRYADDIVFSTAHDFPEIEEDTRNVRRIKYGTVGIAFRGTGAGNLLMAIENIHIERNHFYDYMVNGSGLYLTAHDYLLLPVSDVKMSSGSISFWIKTDYNLNGIDMYGNYAVRNIFSMINNSNDTFGFYIGAGGFVFYGGNVVEGLNVFSGAEKTATTGVDHFFHVGISFSNTGEHIDADGSTIRFYINNILYARVFDTWRAGDSKFFKFVVGGRSVFAANLQVSQSYSALDAVISNLRICNFCRVDFSKDMEINYESDRSVLFDSSELIEISKDNVTFYKVGSVELPLIYEEVPYLDKRTVYIRSNFKNKALTGREDRMAGLLVQWDVPTG